jgi:hypothetical protein
MVIKDATKRDQLKKDLGVLCVEMGRPVCWTNSHAWRFSSSPKLYTFEKILYLTLTSMRIHRLHETIVPPRLEAFASLNDVLR